MRRVSVRLERLGSELRLGIWGIRKGKEEEVVVAAVQTVGGRVDPKRVRGEDGQIVIGSDHNPGSLQKRVVGALKEALFNVSVRGKTKNINTGAT